MWSKDTAVGNFRKGKCLQKYVEKEQVADLKAPVQQILSNSGSFGNESFQISTHPG